MRALLQLRQCHQRLALPTQPSRSDSSRDRTQRTHHGHDPTPARACICCCSGSSIRAHMCLRRKCGAVAILLRCTTCIDHPVHPDRIAAADHCHSCWCYACAVWRGSASWAHASILYCLSQEALLYACKSTLFALVHQYFGCDGLLLLALHFLLSLCCT